jgi:hypothetical protein
MKKILLFLTPIILLAACNEDNPQTVEKEDYMNVAVNWVPETVDNDGDGYARLRTLLIGLRSASGKGTGYARISYKGKDWQTGYLTYFVTPALSAAELDDNYYYLKFGLPNKELPHNEYDIQIEAFVAGSTKVGEIETYHIVKFESADED